MYLVSQAKKQRFLAQETALDSLWPEPSFPVRHGQLIKDAVFHLQLVRRSSRPIRLTTLDITNLNHTMGRVGIEPTT
jgi:hypothetical protein